MLPLDSRDLKAASSSTRFIDVKFPDYVRRLCDFRQMDFESTFDQIFTLLSVEPQSVYISFYYRKQTKNQWARDDPAFVVVQGAFVAVCALAYAIVFRHASIWSYLWAILYCVVVDWLLIGFAVASTCSVEQEVEWLYAFDVHVNAFSCSFMLTYVLQYFLLPLLLGRSALSCVVANTLYAAALLWYAYITYLGYRALPFLGNTQVFLWYPSVAIGFGWLFSIMLLVLGLRFNLTRVVMAFHYG